MELVDEVPIEPRSLEAFEDVLSGRSDALRAPLRDAADRLAGRTVWQVNSTARGGGVAEMLHALLPYAKDAGWNVRWVVVGGDDEFFEVTKGLHHALHGVPPADEIWNEFDRVYRSMSDRNARDFCELVRPGDVAIVHDPQAAGLIPCLRDAGARVSWQCHIGTDTPNDCTRLAWNAMHPFVDAADRYVFTRRQYLWERLDPERLRVIPPTIDPLATKNAPLTSEQVRSILAAAGVIDGEASDTTFHRPDGTTGRVDRRAALFGGGPIPDGAPIVLQVSRWDRLKDPVGFIRMFAGHLDDVGDLYGVYAGPAIAAVDDDPEGDEVRAACEEVWRSLRPATRERLRLVSVPMDDLDENAAVVNALQCRADVIVQKSLREGFGLTVAEAMWKARPVVASRVGGIQDQIEDGRTGVLVDDPYDIGAFARAVRELIDDRERAEALGRAGQDHVREHFLGPRQLQQYAELVMELVACS